MLSNFLMRRKKKKPRDIHSNPTCSVTQPTLFHGISKEVLLRSIDELQKKLNEHGFPVELTGLFDEATEQAVKQFQQSRGLTVDGEVGPLTWAALKFPTLSRKHGQTPRETQALRTLQEILQSEGFLKEVTNRFDRKTESGLKRFQRAHGLLADGECGPMTWSVLTGQRPKCDLEQTLKKKLGFSWDWLILEQLLIIAAIHIGIHTNPLEVAQELPFLRTLIVSYGLAWITLFFFEKLHGSFFQVERFFLFRLAPYVLVGFFWQPIISHLLGIVKLLLIKQ